VESGLGFLIWRCGNLKIWKFENVEMWKCGVLGLDPPQADGIWVLGFGSSARMCL
jgi:hypothetical protein